MRDMTTPANLADIMRGYEQRIEALEMSQRVVRGRSLVSMFKSPNWALSAPASLGVLGDAAAYTDQPAFTNLWIGDFVATGTELQGTLYYWLAPAHVMDVQVTVTEIGAGLSKAVVYTLAGITASGIGTYWDATIPAAAYNGDDVRGKNMRMEIDAKLVTGADQVGVALLEIPYNEPAA